MSDEQDGGPRTLRLSVPAMDCQSCVGKVTAAVETVEGVREVDARAATGRLTVTHGAAASTAAITAAVERAGYAVAEADGSGGAVAAGDPVLGSRRAATTASGAAFLVAALAVEFLVPALDLALVAGLGRTVSVADVGFLLAVALAGTPVLRAGAASLRYRRFDIDLLMAGGIGGAIAVGLYLEGAMIAVLFSVAELLERYSLDRARDSLRELTALAPDTATVQRDGEERTVPAADVAVGDLVVVRPGERLPVDGVVRAGESAVDESPVTGESLPVTKATGDEVYAGTIADGGYLEVEATAPAAESTIARIVELVTDAEAGQTRHERFVDRFARYYTPAVVAAALLTASVPPLVLGWPWRPWFVRGLTLLVLACPCAFVISTPVGVVSGVTAAARNGVLVKGGEHLEAMGAVEAVALDKTGTLTTGELSVAEVVPLGDRDEADVLACARGLEARSEHPLAAAIVSAADARGIEPAEVTSFEAMAGEGVRADLDGTTHYAGKPALFADLGFDLGHAHLSDDAGDLLADGGERTDGSRTSSDRRSDGGEGTDGSRASSAERRESDGGESSEARRATSDRRSDDVSGERSESEARRGAERNGGGVAVAAEESCEVGGCVDLGGTIAALAADGRTVVLVGTAEEIEGVIAVADTVRPEAARTVARLRELGLAVTMLTGDNERTARAVADQVGIDRMQAGLLPEEKVEAIRALTDAHDGVAMVGDGVNDAPALAAATVGVAMGAAGTDAAIETADVALLGDDLLRLPYLVRLSRRATRVIRQNIAGSLGAKALLALGVPFGLVGVVEAIVVGDMGMSLGVTGNAMRLAGVAPEVDADPADEEAAP